MKLSTISSVIAISIATSCAVVTPVNADTLSTWSGAGPNACLYRCSQDWAEDRLTDEDLRLLRIEQEQYPEPYFIWLHDGDVLEDMSFFDSESGSPVWSGNTTVVDINRPTSARGWRLPNGRSFIRIDECKNWTIMIGENIGTNYNTGFLDDGFDYDMGGVGVTTVPGGSMSGASASGGGGSSYSNASSGGSSGSSSAGSSSIFSNFNNVVAGDTFTDNSILTSSSFTEVVNYYKSSYFENNETLTPEVAAVPIPASILFLLSSVTGLVFLNRKSKEVN